MQQRTREQTVAGYHRREPVAPPYPRWAGNRTWWQSVLVREMPLGESFRSLVGRTNERRSLAACTLGTILSSALGVAHLCSPRRVTCYSTPCHSRISTAAMIDLRRSADGCLAIPVRFADPSMGERFASVYVALSLPVQNRDELLYCTEAESCENERVVQRIGADVEGSAIVAILICGPVSQRRARKRWRL